MNTALLKTAAIGVLTVMALSACASNNHTQKENTMLSQYHWNLISATDGVKKPLGVFYAGATQPRVQVNFKDKRLGIKGSCNQLSGSYEANANTVTAGSFMSTLIGCSTAHANQDQAMGNFFSKQTVHYAIDTTNNNINQNPVLTVKNLQGQILTFQGNPTAETKYGSKYDMVFLEVQGKTQTCNAGVMTQECLVVKEVRYNEQGLKTYQDSKWSRFYDHIEGYTHRPDTDVTLRLKRFERFKDGNIPQDVPSPYVYVLDMIVSQAPAK